MAKINVKDMEIVVFKKEQEDYISLTDIAKVRDTENPSFIMVLVSQPEPTVLIISFTLIFNTKNQTTKAEFHSENLLSIRQVQGMNCLNFESV